MTTDTLRLYPGGHEVGYDLGREAGEGVVLSIDLAGHHDLDVIDLVLAHVSAHPDEFGTPWDDDNPAPFGYLDIEHLWRSTRHPEGCDDPDGEDWPDNYDEWHYSPTETEGAVPVTRLSRDHSWDQRCAWHPREKASAALPAAEYLALEPSATTTTFDTTRTRYVYLCGTCRASALDRINESHRQRAESIERLTSAGFTPNQAARMCVPTVAAPTTEERQT